MSQFRSYLLAILFFLLGALSLCRAQNRIRVQGTVLYMPSREPIVTAEIFGYNTLEEAREALGRAQAAFSKAGAKFDPGYCLQTVVMENGSYEFEAIDRDGAILFIVRDAEEPVQIRAVRGHTKIDVSFNLTMLDAATVSINKIKPIIRKPTVLGNTLKCGMERYPFPKPHLGRSNGRLVIQTYVLDLNAEPGKDTVEYHYPIVMDGEEYYRTQLRRKGFRVHRDPLLEVSESTRETYGWLTDTTDHVGWEDSYYLEDPGQQVKIWSRLWWEDYNTVYYRDSLNLADSRRVSRPMRFLDYDVRSYALDMENSHYLRTARPERRDDSRDLALQFEVGSARIDEKDSTSMAEMGKLLSSIQAIVDDTANGSRMNEYSVYGTASPEGNYQRNRQLASRRMEYIRERIQSIVRRKIGAYQYADVASWEELADTLEASQLLQEAEAVRAIVKKYPGNMDVQGARVRTLPYYKTLIVPKLEKLRRVRVVYKYELFRNLTEQEILHKYRTDPAVRSGAADLMAYEYWSLMKLIRDSVITDPGEQEDILRRAVKLARLRDKNWQLPENMLAQFIIDHGMPPDTTLLAPHVDFDFYDEKSDGTRLWADRDYTALSGESYVKNPSAVVANQVVMMMKAGKYERAADLAQILKTSKDSQAYLRLYYIARCLGGYFNDDQAADADELYRAIEGTSPRNSFVINLAMGKFPQAQLDLEEMDPEDPVTHYLHAQLICQKHYDKGTTVWSAIPSPEDQETALKELARCFRMDPKYIGIAQTDFDIFEDLIKPAVEESKKAEEPAPEAIAVPEGLMPDPDNPGWYFNKKGTIYEYVDGQFLSLETGQVYKP